MSRPLHTTAAITACLLLAGCTGGSGTGSGAPSRTPSPTGKAGSSVSAAPLLSGLDVCSLASPAEVQRAGGQEGDPSLRTLTSLPGYRGVADECGFGVSFDSASLRVAVGLAPATRADVRRAGGRPVRGPWAVARARVDADTEQVTFLRGTTLVRLRVPRVTGAPSRLAPLTKAAATLATRVPSEPPESDAQTTGRCTEVDRDRVDAVLGAPAAVSRSLAYPNGSVTCSWATGTTRARTVTVSLYTVAQTGPFLATLRTSGPSADVPGVKGDAFTTPTAGYLISEDGQAIAVTGRFGRPHRPGRPVPVTPALTALMNDAAGLLR